MAGTGYTTYSPVLGATATFHYGFIVEDYWSRDLIGPDGETVHKCFQRIYTETKDFDVSKPYDKARYDITRDRILEAYGCHLSERVPAYPHLQNKKPHAGGNRRGA